MAISMRPVAIQIETLAIGLRAFAMSPEQFAKCLRHFECRKVQIGNPRKHLTKAALATHQRRRSICCSPKAIVSGEIAICSGETIGARLMADADGDYRRANELLPSSKQRERDDRPCSSPYGPA
jgi:hypothetical protein